MRKPRDYWLRWKHTERPRPNATQQSGRGLIMQPAQREVMQKAREMLSSAPVPMPKGETLDWMAANLEDYGKGRFQPPTP